MPGQVTFESTDPFSGILNREVFDPRICTAGRNQVNRGDPLEVGTRLNHRHSSIISERIGIGYVASVGPVFQKTEQRPIQGNSNHVRTNKAFTGIELGIRHKNYRRTVLPKSAGYVGLIKVDSNPSHIFDILISNGDEKVLVEYKRILERGNRNDTGRHGSDYRRRNHQ